MFNIQRRISVIIFRAYKSEVQYSTVQYSTVQCGAVQCSTVQNRITFMIYQLTCSIAGDDAEDKDVLLSVIFSQSVAVSRNKFTMDDFPLPLQPLISTA